MNTHVVADLASSAKRHQRQLTVALAAASDAIRVGAWRGTAGPLNLARHEAVMLGLSTSDIDLLVEGLDTTIRSFLDAIDVIERYAIHLNERYAVYLNDATKIAAQ